MLMKNIIIFQSNKPIVVDAVKHHQEYYLQESISLFSGFSDEGAVVSS